MATSWSRCLAVQNGKGFVMMNLTEKTEMSFAACWDTLVQRVSQLDQDTESMKPGREKAWMTSNATVPSLPWNNVLLLRSYHKQRYTTAKINPRREHEVIYLHHWTEDMVRLRLRWSVSPVHLRSGRYRPPKNRLEIRNPSLSAPNVCFPRSRAETAKFKF